MAINKYNPNTGKKLKKGESVVNKSTGQKVTQGTTFGGSSSSNSSKSSSSSVPSGYVMSSTGNLILKNPASTPTATTGAVNTQASTLTPQQAQQGYSTIPGPYDPLTGKLKTEITAESLKTEQPIKLPEPEAPATNANLILSAQAEADKARKSLEANYAKQKADLDKQATASQKKIDELNVAVEGTITEDVNRLSTPFREQLETSERERLSVNKNFEENQKLVGELEGLLTEGNQLIEQQKGITGLSGIRNPRINQAIESVNSRAAVLQAVMAARNGQISQAGNLIDRSVEAITADRKDQLGFYSTLVNYYTTLKDEEGKKLVTLTSAQKDVLNNQVKLLQDDLKRTQDNAEALKEALTNPATAMAYAQAGVTLNDSTAQINAKLAKYAYTQQVAETSEAMVGKGYATLTKEQAALKPADELIKYTDSQGKEHIFWKQSDAKEDIRLVDGGLFDVKNNKWIVKSGGGTTGGQTYTSDLDALIGNTTNTISSKFGQETFRTSISNARNDADKLNTIATVALKNSPATIREDFINQTVALKQIDKALSLIDNGVKSGILGAAGQYVFNVFGKDFDPKLAQVNQYIISAIQPYRNSVTGAAWGTQEEEEYRQLFGNIKYSPTELKQRLEGIKEIMKDKTITALNAQVNPLGQSNQFDTTEVDTGNANTGLGGYIDLSGLDWHI